MTCRGSSFLGIYVIRSNNKRGTLSGPASQSLGRIIIKEQEQKEKQEEEELKEQEEQELEYEEKKK